MSIVKRVAKNYFSLAFAEVLIRIISFCVVVYIARHLGPQIYGKISFGMAIVSFFIVISSFGLPMVGIREISRHKEKANVYAGNIFTLRFLLSLASFVLLFVIVTVPSIPFDTKIIILVLGLTMVMDGAGVYWIFNAYERMELTAVLKVFDRLIYAVLVFSFLSYYKTPYTIVISNLAATSCMIIASILVASKLVKIRLTFDLKLWKEFFNAAVPIGISAILITVYNNTDTIMLSFMKGEATVGWYNAGYKIMGFLAAMGAYFVSAVFPILSSKFKTSKESLGRIFEKSVKVMVSVAIPLAFGGALLAPKIITSVFGVQYAPGVQSFQVLLIAVGVMFLNMIYGNFLIACNRQNDFTIAVFCGAIVNAILNFILIPHYSLFGASLATLITVILVFVLNYISSQKIIKTSVFRYFLVPAISSLGMLLAIYFIRDLNLFITIPFGGFVYLALFLLFKGVSKEDMEILSKAFKKPIEYGATEEIGG